MSVERRSAELEGRLRAEVPGPLELEWTALVCNGCGRAVRAPDAEALAEATRGWFVGIEFGALDFCPDCAGAP